MKIELETARLSGEEELEAEDVGDVLEELDIDHTNAVVTVNGEICLRDEELEEGDKVKIREVDSNG